MPPRVDDSSSPSKRSLLEANSSTSPSSLSSSSSSSEELEESRDGDVAIEPKVSSGFYYLSPTAQYHLPRFQYRGQDLSLLYNYILSPLAGRLVDLLPTHVAPNTITLVGLLFMVTSYLIFWFYSPDLTTRLPSPSLDDHEQQQQQLPPRWIFLCNSLSMLLYQTFDNMDGKQARRTNSTSPLGLLFDHGCDAVNSLFGSTNWMIAMALHPRFDALACWILLLGPYSLFYVGTWEEYYTGKLVLPIVNGPNEGLLGGAVLSLTSYWYGSLYWQDVTWSAALATYFLGDSVPLLRNADWVILAASLGFLQECCLKIGSVVRRHGVHTALTLLPFFTLLVCSLVLMVGVGTSNSSISNHCWLTLPRTWLHLVASLFVEMTTALMLAHISNTPYQPWRWTLLPLVVLTAVTIITTTPWSSNSLVVVAVPSDIWVWYAAASCTYLAVKSCLVIHEICEVLHIWCFDITTPRRRTKAIQQHPSSFKLKE